MVNIIDSIRERIVISLLVWAQSPKINVFHSIRRSASSYLDEDECRVGLASELDLEVVNGGRELALGLVGAVIGVTSTGERGSCKDGAASTTPARGGGRSRSRGSGGGLGRLLHGLFDLLGLGGKAAAVKAGSLASGTAEHDCFSIGDTARQKK